jgi:hypothetical protein
MQLTTPLFLLALGVDEPKELAVPKGHQLVASFRAEGVQVYKAVEGKSGGLEWSLEGPLADLKDKQGRWSGNHYGGPAWESADGSKVILDRSVPVKPAPAEDPADIPWLLLKVKAAQGKPGLFASVAYVQRVNTIGGKAPTEPPKRAGMKVAIPYRAEYRLWAKAE